MGMASQVRNFQRKVTDKLLASVELHIIVGKSGLIARFTSLDEKWRHNEAFL